MKKFILPVFVAVATISGATGYFNQPTTPQLNALGIANLEALSYDEWGFDTCCDFTRDMFDMCIKDTGPILYGL